MAKKIKIEYKPRLKYNAWGLAYKDERRVEIKQSLEPFDKFETEIHELQHIIYPYLEEDAVDKGSRTLAEHLWELGYRKI